MFILRTFLSLIKYKISLAVSFTTVAAFVVCKGAFGMELTGLIAGVFLLSSGALALNQLQESSFDALMNRTEKRPIPLGHIKKNEALVVILLLLSAGLGLLFIFTPAITFILGIFNVFWYNAVYTPLKRHSIFAVIPGSLIGAVPALMGWTAAGCHILDVRIISLSAFLVLWQIPHFWLILYFYNEDYKKAGFPDLSNSFSFQGIKYIVVAWLITTCFSTLLFPIVGLIKAPFFIITLVCVNVLFALLVFLFVLRKKLIVNKIPLMVVNIFMLFIMLAVMMQALIL